MGRVEALALGFVIGWFIVGPAVDHYCHVKVGLKVAIAADAPKPMACHLKHDDASLTNIETLKEIDSQLDTLYTHMKLDADFDEECTHAVEFPVEGESEKESVVLTELLEQLEIRRNSYERGIWGYCAMEGAKNLKQTIENLINVTKAIKASNQTVIICNRDKLLICSPASEKEKSMNKTSSCGCLMDNKDFRNLASQYMKSSEDEDDNSRSVQNSTCMLITGSDCAFTSESPLLCERGSSCKFKRDRTPCTTMNNGYQEEDAAKNKSNSTGTNETEEVKNYRFIKTFYPTTYCQCYNRDSRIYFSFAGFLPMSLSLFPILLHYITTAFDRLIIPMTPEKGKLRRIINFSWH